MSEDNEKDFPGMGMNGDIDVPVGPKKAVHVKWAGKTIALGTFPVAEADEKCQKAKALTRAWRSTMRPKPTREWVMLELERRNVRVVNGRVGRGDGSDGEHDNQIARQDANQNSHTGQMSNEMSSLLNAANVADFGRNGSLQQNNNINFRNNNLGIDPSLFLGDQRRNNGFINPTGTSNNIAAGPKRSTSPDLVIPPHRPLVGGGSAAAYEAARADHYRKLAEQKKSQKQDGSTANIASTSSKSSEKSQKSGSKSSSFFQQQSNSAISNGSSMNGLNMPLSEGSNQQSGAGMPNLNISVNANQHYEMLKLHHMNLLNEIQETTLMMNLYQQHQLQLQQQQQQELIQQQQQQEKQKKLLEEAATGDFNSKLSLLAAQGSMMQNDMESGYGQLGFSGADINPSGDPESSPSPSTVPALSSSEVKESNASLSNDVAAAGLSEATGTSDDVSPAINNASLDVKDSPSKASREEQLRKIQQEIAERQRMLKELETLDETGEESHHNDYHSEHSAKRMKTSEINDCEV